MFSRQLMVARKCRSVLLLFYFTIVPALALAQTSQKYRDSLQALIDNGPQDTAMVGRLIRLGTSYPLAESGSILPLTGRAYLLAKKIRYLHGAALALLWEIKVNRVAGDFETALRKGLECIKTYEAAGLPAQAAFTEIELAQVYKDMTADNQTAEYTTMAIGYAKNAFARFRGLRDTAGMVHSLNMCGILFRDRAKTAGSQFYDSAFFYYRLAFALIGLSGKGRECSGKLNNNISQVYLEDRKDYHKALEHLFKAVEFNVTNKKTSSLSFNYGNISNAYVHLKDYANAIRYARLMVAATEKENAPARMQNAYKQMYVAFEAKGRYDSALHYFILNDSITDVLTNLSRTQQVVKLQLGFETAKKESEIARLAKEGLRQKKSIALLIGFLIFLVVLVATVSWLYHRVKTQKRQIDLQAQRLEAVMKELHHRVKNNLQIVSSLLSLQTYKLHDAEAILVFKESQQRVQAMSLIHQRLYTSDLLTAVNMKEYITDLAETLLASYGFGRDDFHLQLNIQQEVLDVEKALPIGLLINELVTNSLKYAYHDIDRPCLVISLTNVNEQLTLVVRDNGAGIDVEEWKKKGSSFGKQLIKVLGKQLRAQQTVEGNNGTAFTIVIPNKAA